MIYFLATCATISMAVVALVGWSRWEALDRASRFIAVGFGVLAVIAVLAFAMVRVGSETRWLQEISILVATPIFMLGFSEWHVSRAAIRAIRWLIGTFVLLWAIVQVSPARLGSFSTVSTPIHDILLIGTAAYTLYARAKASAGQWTSKGWLWVTLGFMAIYGTEVVLDPAWSLLFGRRNDLVSAAYQIHLVTTIVGSMLVARGMTLPNSPEKAVLANAGP